MKMDVRRLDDGSCVVDLGSKWFRQMPSGVVIARETVAQRGTNVGIVRTRPASMDEIKMVREAVEKSGLNP